jgi:predicted secreted protein
MNNQEGKFVFMAETIALSVALRQIKLREDPEYFRSEWKKLTKLDNIIEQAGENILYKSDKPGVTSEAFNAMCQAIALLSFVPGGVHIFGRHFICERKNGV